MELQQSRSNATHTHIYTYSGYKNIMRYIYKYYISVDFILFSTPPSTASILPQLTRRPVNVTVHIQRIIFSRFASYTELTHPRTIFA